MESLAALFALAIVAAVTVVPVILSLSAFARSRRVPDLLRRLDDLEREVDNLRRRLQVMRQAAREEAPAPAATEPPPPSIPKPVPVPAPPEKPPTVAAPPPTVAATPPAPPRPMPPPPPPSPPEAPSSPIDWERWIGIRGAAVLGGIVLALAGLLFFQYSVQHGLITPAMRVALGIAVGLACLGASEWLRPRDYKVTPEGLAGAGVVVLYAAFWAGHAMYQLLPLTLTFVLMALTTATCGLIAVRRDSRLVAVLGLAGGFATPLLLSSGEDRPIGLFGYVLLLDVGLLAVGRRRRWPWLGLLGLGGTALLQLLWIGWRMGPDRLLLGLAILAVFAVLFAATGFAMPEDDRKTWRIPQAGALLIPFAFAFYFAARADLGPHLWAVAAFLAGLGIAASWVGRRIEMKELAVAAAVGSVAVVGVWAWGRPLTTATAWEAAAIAVGLATIYHVAFELDAAGAGFDGSGAAAMIAAGGGLVVLIAASMRSLPVPTWPWLAGWLALAGLLARDAARAGIPALQIGSALAVGAGLALQHVLHLDDPSFPPAATFLGACAAVAALAQVVSFLFREEPARREADRAAAVVALLVSGSLLASKIIVEPTAWIALATPLIFGLLVLLAATRLGEGGWGLAAVVVTAAVDAHWVFAHRPRSELVVLAPGAMVFLLATAAVFVIWPFLAGGRLAASKPIWWAGAAAGPLAFFPLKVLWAAWRGTSGIGLVPVVLGAMALAAAFGARRSGAFDERSRRTALVGFSAVAICFASVAIPLQLDKSWLTIGWALEGLGLVALWTRLDHPGLKWFGLAHLGAAAFRLVPDAVLLDSYPRSGTPIVNWLLYTYLVPAIAMFASAWLLAPAEASRARLFEKELYAKGHAVGAIAASIGGIFTIFVWINLAIADWFTDGPRLTLAFGRSPARDLTVSIAWAVYALVLLGIGMARGKTGLRWLSLGFLIVTIGKVFLYDLGELRDLYRVVSLVGLALSLLLVSVLYQRFVFRRRGGNSP